MSAERFKFQLNCNSVNFDPLRLWLEDGATLACLLLGAWHANVRVLFPPNFTEESVHWANEHSELWLTDRDIELEKCEQISQFGITQDWKKVAKKSTTL